MSRPRGPDFFFFVFLDRRFPPTHEHNSPPLFVLLLTFGFRGGINNGLRVFLIAERPYQVPEETWASAPRWITSPSTQPRMVGRV